MHEDSLAPSPNSAAAGDEIHRSDSAAVQGDAQRPLWHLLLATVAGASVAWAVLAAAYPFFEVPREISNMPSPPPLEMLERLRSVQRELDVYNVTLAVGLVGMLIAIALAAGALWPPRGHGGSALKLCLLAAGVGLLVGGLAGCASQLMLSRLEQFGGHDAVLSVAGQQVRLDPMMQIMLVQMIAWSLLGLALGGLLGFMNHGAADTAKLALTGALGGALGAAVYVPLQAVLLPMEPADTVVPRGPGAQLLWLLVASIMIALLTGLIGRGLRAARQSSNSASEATAIAAQ